MIPFLFLVGVWFIWSEDKRVGSTSFVYSDGIWMVVDWGLLERRKGKGREGKEKACWFCISRC